MNNETIVALIFLCLLGLTFIEFVAIAIVEEIRYKNSVKKAKNFLKENPRFVVYATTWLFFQQKIADCLIQIDTVKKTLQDLIDSQIYVKKDSLPEYFEKLEELKGNLELYEKNRVEYLGKQEQSYQQMVDYMKEKFPILCPKKIVDKVWFHVNHVERKRER